jgi:transposase
MRPDIIKLPPALKAGDSIAWLGLDAHAKSCLLAWMDEQGRRRGHWRFPTTEREIVRHLQGVAAPTKHLAVEECGLGRWIAQVAKPHVTRVVVCDPRENHHISRHHHKCDEEDGYGLAHLNRLGALKEVWQPSSDARAVFKCAAQGYLDAVQRQTALKLQLKAHYRQWGVIPSGQRVYSRSERGRWLARVNQVGVRAQLQLLYEGLDNALEVQRKARRLMVHLGTKFAEIGCLRTFPGIGLIGAHLFVAYVQEPGRFETPQRLFRYCRLGIRDRSSDGKPLGYEQLDRQGHGVLKAVSYRAWLGAMKRRTGAVYDFYTQSLARTGSDVHARLNTQRKILLSLLVMWEKQVEFNPQEFLSPTITPTAQATCG